jgi:hypothetical protein
MGWVYAKDIKKAADYLLKILCDEIEVRYSRFYDGTDQTAEKLVADMGYPEEGDDFIPESAELLIDLAAGELQRQGFVQLKILGEELADDEPDYLIELTIAGFDKIADGVEPVFRDMDM